MCTSMLLLYTYHMVCRYRGTIQPHSGSRLVVFTYKCMLLHLLVMQFHSIYYTVVF